MTSARVLPLPTPLDRLHGVCRRWLGNDYDLDVIDAVVATAAAERLTGDPAWLLVVSGSGTAKTEVVQALAGGGAVVTSSIASEGALLSGSPKRERSTDATGGLLCRLGTRGILAIKDVTTILSMHRDTRASVLAALREVHDGFWERNLGTDGGRTLTWRGRIVIVGACTTAWDRAHEVVASMGDRFVVIRADSSRGRERAGRQAMENTGAEVEMRRHLAAAVGAVLATVDPPQRVLKLTKADTTRLLAAANVVTLCRTGVDFDYHGNVVDAHAPEMPTRFAKQLVQIMRGAYASGLPREQARRLALRCARDSMPPLRLTVLEDVARHPHTRTQDVRRRIGKPRSTVDRQLQALHQLGALTCDEVASPQEFRPASVWYYSVVASLTPEALTIPALSARLTAPALSRTAEYVPSSGTDITGKTRARRARRRRHTKR